VAHFLREPIRAHECLLGIIEFDFRHHQSRVSAFEDVDLKARIGLPPDVAGLLHSLVTAEFQ